MPIRFHEIFNNYPTFGGDGHLETIFNHDKSYQNIDLTLKIVWPYCGGPALN